MDELQSTIDRPNLMHSSSYFFPVLVSEKVSTVYQFYCPSLDTQAELNTDVDLARCCPS